MTISAWFTSADSYVIHSGRHYEAPITVTVDPGTGNVQIQFKNSAGTWTTPADVAFTIDAFGVYELPRANVPEARIIATGNAQFQIQRR